MAYWVGAPSWAEYIATDEDGSIYWYEYEPRLRTYDWIDTGGWKEYCGKKHVNTNWKESLTLRYI